MATIKITIECEDVDREVKGVNVIDMAVISAVECIKILSNSNNVPYEIKRETNEKSI
jgi:hypothetical protein